MSYELPQLRYNFQDDPLHVIEPVQHERSENDDAKLMREIAPVIADHVQRALWPLSFRITELVARVTELERKQR